MFKLWLLSKPVSVQLKTDVEEYDITLLVKVKYNKHNAWGISNWFGTP